MTVQSSDCEKKFKADTLENEDCLTKSFKQEQIGYELYNVVLDDVGLHMRWPSRLSGSLDVVSAANVSFSDTCIRVLLEGVLRGFRSSK